jgi:hypothetical protein
MQEYSNLIDKIQARYNPDFINEVQVRSLSDIRGINQDIAKYVKLAMNEVDEYYTQITMNAGENVKQHLKDELSCAVDLRYQGSVMTQTHIKGVSDIDLLTITKKFDDTDYIKAKNIVETVQTDLSYLDVDRIKRWIDSFSQYLGDANSDLLALRMEDEKIMKGCYSICDISKGKSIKITNTHYHRDVDVVIASWHDSVDYIRGCGDIYRGLQIYNKTTNMRIGPDFPFLSIERINQRSTETGGRLKRMIRFLKNVRTDADVEILLTSFDINAICYDIPKSQYEDLYYLQLVCVMWNKLYHLCNNLDEADNLKSVDGSEYIFRNNSSKLENLKKLESQVWDIYQKIKS